MLTLYFAPGSSSQAAHIAMEESEAIYEKILIDEAAGEHKTDAYLRINPRGKVPALRLPDGSVLVENVAIQTYIARKYPRAKLLPEDPIGEARALSIMAYFATTVHPAFSHYFAPARFTDDPIGEPGVKTRGLQAFHGHCKDIDVMLLDREWFLGPFSTVDCYGFVFYGWGQRAGLPMADLANYTAHRNRMLGRASVQRALASEGIKVS